MSRNIQSNKSFVNKHRSVIISLFLCISILSVYWQVNGYDFVNYDDTEYITQNRQVQNGITPENIVWAFTTIHASNWHPLTWLSHMLDCQLFGLNPGQHHLTNLFFHIANALLLFFVFRKMTGRIWQSAFIAAVFALHPLHVESVAWVSERKDVLSAFFFLLTLWSYLGYVNQQTTGRYLLVLLFFTLGLMSKPMLVTLPFVLLLLDVWPLGRFRFLSPDAHLSSRPNVVSFSPDKGKNPLIFACGRIKRYHILCAKSWRCGQVPGGHSPVLTNRQCPCFLCRLYRENDLSD